MTDPVQVMNQYGLRNADVIVRAANKVGLALYSAATLVQKESNGLNIWGHDPVDTGGTYIKGGPVTQANYWAYRKHPTAGWQGVGLCQLTYKGYIYQTEKINPQLGAADPYTNCVVGFQAFLDLWKQANQNVQLAFQHYNGGTSNSAASIAYGKDAMAKRATWMTRLR